MIVSNVSFILSKKENPEFLTLSDDENEEYFVEIKADTKSILIKLEYSDRAENEEARIKRWFDSCDFIKVEYESGYPVVRFHSDKPLEGYSEEFLTNDEGFFAETFMGSRFFDHKLLNPERY